jgi:hypothetical protein
MDKASNSLSQTPPRPNGSPWRRPIVDGRLFMLKVYAVGEARQIVKARLKAANEKCEGSGRAGRAGGRPWRRSCADAGGHCENRAGLGPYALLG